MYKDNKRFVTDSSFIKESLKKKLSLNEFLLLLYFDNSFDEIFNSDVISKMIGISNEDLLVAYSSLIKKNLIKVKAEKNEFGKIVEKVSIDGFYKDITLEKKEIDKKEEKQDIFSEFESSFGRTLSSMDYEIINAWIDKGFQPELISAALKEAVYNGVTNLRYVDKVLYEWNRKGFKTCEDVKKGLLNSNNEGTLYETSLMNFDWLHEK